MRKDFPGERGETGMAASGKPESEREWPEFGDATIRAISRRVSVLPG